MNLSLMETTETCPIQQHLASIKASSCSITDLTSFLNLLKDIVSDLTSRCFDGKYCTLDKHSSIFLLGLLKTHAAQEFLKVLGYKEEGSQYVYTISDENYMKAESCMNLLQNWSNTEEISSLENVCEDDMFDELKNELSPKQTRSLPNLRDQSEGKEEKCSGVTKNVLLSRHLKKEQSIGIFDSLKVAMECRKKSPTCSVFNMNGYFHQSSSSSRETRKSKCFLKDFFHKQENGHKGRTISNQI